MQGEQTEGRTLGVWPLQNGVEQLGSTWAGSLRFAVILGWAGILLLGPGEDGLMVQPPTDLELGNGLVASRWNRERAGPTPRREQD